MVTVGDYSLLYEAGIIRTYVYVVYPKQSFAAVGKNAGTNLNTNIGATLRHPQSQDVRSILRIPLLILNNRKSKFKNCLPRQYKISKKFFQSNFLCNRRITGDDTGGHALYLDSKRLQRPVLTWHEDARSQEGSSELTFLEDVNEA